MKDDTKGTEHLERPTLGKIAKMTDKQMMNSLFNDTAHGQIYRDGWRRFLLRDGFDNPYDWLVAPFRAEIGELKKECAQLRSKLVEAQEEIRKEEPSPEKKSGRKESWKEPWEMAEYMLEAGWRGEGMRDPRDVVRRLLAERNKRTTWADVAERPEDIQESIRNFWSAAIDKFELWKADSQLEEYE